MNNVNPHIVLAGGGTAGHVNPLLSVADAIKRIVPEASLSVIGTAVGLERELVPAAGYELDTIEKVPFPRRPDLNALRFPARWIREGRKVREILASRHADVVAGFGGYASAPVYAAAHKMGVPVALHESNARAGMANRLGARWADYIGVVYENTGLAPREHALLERVGLPLRPPIAALADRFATDRDQVRVEAAEALGLSPDQPVVLVTGGSLGAVSVNRAVAGAADELLEYAQVVHLTGKGKLAEIKNLVDHVAGDKAFTGLGPDHAHDGDWHAAEYLERIDLAFACADLVICRSGAGMVSELTALGLPAIYVPLPVGNGEQRYNAQPVVSAGGGLMVADADFTTGWVRDHVPELLANPQRLREIGAKAWGYGIRDAADRMARRVLALAGWHDPAEESLAGIVCDGNGGKEQEETR